MATIFTAIIQKVNYEKYPYNISYKRYNNRQSLSLENGISIDNDPLLEDIVVYTVSGTAYKPSIGEKARITIDDDGNAYAEPVDTFVKPVNLTDSGSAFGNFKTKNFIRFENDVIKVVESGTKNINFLSSEKIVLAVGSNIVEISESGIKINGNFEVIGNSKFKGTVIANDKPIDETHMHSGVMSGPATTGPVV